MNNSLIIILFSFVLCFLFIIEHPVSAKTIIIKCDRTQGFLPSTINGVDCCYNESKKLGYREFGTHERYFNINGYECGKNCDFDGKNCSEGICNISDCAIDFVSPVRSNS